MSTDAPNARQVARSRPVKVGARIGLIAYGLTHLLIAWLALQVAREGGEQADQKAPSRRPARRSAGAAVGAGDRVRRGRAVAAGAGRSSRRAECRTRRSRSEAGRDRAQAVVFPVLAILAARTARARASGHGQKAAAGVLGWPGGQFLVGAVGLGHRGRGRGEGQARVGEDVPDEMDVPSDQKARRPWAAGQVASIAKDVSSA